MTAKEAISILTEWVDNGTHEFIHEALQLAIEALSQDEQPEIIRCKDCKHHWIHRCMDSMPTEICDLDQTFYDPNIDFCSMAERRTDGTEQP